MAKLELGMISSTWFGTGVDTEAGIRKAKEIGFDTYDIFEDPLDIDDATRKMIKDTCAEVGLPIRSVVCVAFGLVDFNPAVQRFTLDRIMGGASAIPGTAPVCGGSVHSGSRHRCAMSDVGVRVRAIANPRSLL